MIITNKLGLPEPIINFLERKEHRGADYSASMLYNPPQIVILKKRYKDQIVIDASEQIWAILGSAVHSILEMGEGKNGIAEAYFETDIHLRDLNKTVILSGSADYYEDGIISDWKTDSVYTVIYDSQRTAREAQLNTYAYLFSLAGYEVKGLEIISILKDWSKSKAKFDKSYPQTQVIKTPIKLWSRAEQEKYIFDRINLFENELGTPDYELPNCTDEETWTDPKKWAVMKSGRKSAIKLHDSEKDALEHLQTLGAGHYIEVRESEPRRCENYCDVSEFCSQYQAYKARLQTQTKEGEL